MPEEIDYSKIAAAIANHADDEADGLASGFPDGYRERVPARGAIMREGRSERVVTGAERLEKARLLAPAVQRFRESQEQQAQREAALHQRIDDQKEREAGRQKLVGFGGLPRGAPAPADWREQLAWLEAGKPLADYHGAIREAKSQAKNQARQEQIAAQQRADREQLAEQQKAQRERPIEELRAANRGGLGIF